MSVGTNDPAPPAPAPAPSPAPVPAPAPNPPPIDPEKGFQKSLAKMGGDALKLAQRLYRDSFKDRETIRGLTTKVPAEGSIVLAGDELRAFNSLKELGKKPEELAVILKEHGEMKSTEARRQVETTRKEFAELCGYDADVLNKLLDDDNIEIEVQDVPGPNGQPQKGRDGKILRQPMVKSEDPKDKRRSLFTPLPDYIAAKWPKFLPSLKAMPAGAPRPTGSPAPPSGQPAPVPPAPPQRLYGGRSPF